jgi:hypothetical protein
MPSYVKSAPPHHHCWKGVHCDSNLSIRLPLFHFPASLCLLPQHLPYCHIVIWHLVTSRSPLTRLLVIFIDLLPQDLAPLMSTLFCAAVFTSILTSFSILSTTIFDIKLSYRVACPLFVLVYDSHPISTDRIDTDRIITDQISTPRSKILLRGGLLHAPPSVPSHRCHDGAISNVSPTISVDSCPSRFE